MRTTATDLKINLGAYLQKAIKEPVMIEKNHRPAAVLMSIEEYERLTQIEDNYWADRARAAASEGFLGVEESMKYIRDGLDAKA